MGGGGRVGVSFEEKRGIDGSGKIVVCIIISVYVLSLVHSPGPSHLCGVLCALSIAVVLC